MEVNQCLEFSSPLPSDTVTAAEAVVDLAVSKPLLATRPGCAVWAGAFSWQAGGVQPGRVVI